MDATTHLVAEGQESTARAVMRVTDPIDGLRGTVRAVDSVRRLSTSGVLGTVRWSNRAVEAITDVGIGVAQRMAGPPSPVPSPVPMRSDVTRSSTWMADAALGAINGAVGDHLASRENELDLSMSLRDGDRYLQLDEPAWTFAQASRRVAVFLHGLGTTEWSWCLEGEAYHGDPEACFGRLLQRDLDFAPLYVRYNTGRHISENGRALSAVLERLVASYPEPIDDLTLLGHSMGGLVVRSACHHALVAGCTWPGKLRRVFCLGSPHRGAPLARLGHVMGLALGSVDLPATRIVARIIEGRSAGIKDLKEGSVLDEQWLDFEPMEGADPRANAVRVPEVPHYFISASVTEDPNHPVGRLVGDLLVQIPSASGPRCEMREFEAATRCHGGVLHHQIQNHPAVYEQIRRACVEPRS